MKRQPPLLDEVEGPSSTLGESTALAVVPLDVGEATALAVAPSDVEVPVRGTGHVVEMTLATLFELARSAAGDEAGLIGEGGVPREVGPFFIRCSDGFLLVLCVVGCGGIEYRIPLPFDEETVGSYVELRMAWEASSGLKPLHSMEVETGIIESRWSPIAVAAWRKRY